MSLRPTPCDVIPALTITVARAAFPQGNAYLRLRDALGPIFTDAQFAPLFTRRGQPAACPCRLALVTLLQYAENLSDRRTAEAVRGRLDWKYLLGLELSDPGFDASVLSEFRGRLVTGGAEEQLLDTLLAVCRERELLAARGRQRTDATHVLGAVRALNRLECAVETLRAALNVLATVAPEWLRAHANPAWVERYAKRADEYHMPRAEGARRAYAEQVGHDEHQLLAAVTASGAPSWLHDIPALELLRRVWVQCFYISWPTPVSGSEGGDQGGSGPMVRWRTRADGFPPSLLMVASPYDADVHYAKKRTTAWIGYKVHVTETCEENGPHLITHVETTPAPVVDRAVLGRVHAALAAKGVLPSVHLVDGGYVDADQLVASARDYAVTLLGPSPKDQQWQARAADGFAVDDFHLDWDHETATCPAGHTSSSWTADHNQGRAVVKIRFSTSDCRPCPLKSRCTRSARRLLTPRRREEYEALRAARAAEGNPAFCRRISPTRRDRGDPVCWCPSPAPPARPVSWNGQDAPSACSERR